MKPPKRSRVIGLLLVCLATFQATAEAAEPTPTAKLFASMFAIARCGDTCSNYSIPGLLPEYEYRITGVTPASQPLAEYVDVLVGQYSSGQTGGKIHFQKLSGSSPAAVTFVLTPTSSDLDSNPFRRCEGDLDIDNNTITGGKFPLYFDPTVKHQDPKTAGKIDTEDLVFYQCSIFAMNSLVDFKELNYLLWRGDPTSDAPLRRYWEALWELRIHPQNATQITSDIAKYFE